MPNSRRHAVMLAILITPILLASCDGVTEPAPPIALSTYLLERVDGVRPPALLYETPEEQVMVGGGILQLEGDSTFWTIQAHGVLDKVRGTYERREIRESGTYTVSADNRTIRFVVSGTGERYTATVKGAVLTITRQVRPDKKVSFVYLGREVTLPGG